MMTKERRADLEALADKDPHMCLLRELLNEIAELEARAVVVPDDTFTLDLDEFGKSLVCITINSKNRGVGYELCGTMGDGHFSRRTFDITPYLAHCLNTIGIRAIPADRVLGEGEHKTDALLGFRPIETAPKDGSDILLTDGYSCEIAGWGYYNEDSEAGIGCGPEFYDWVFANNEISSPKWWRPIDFLNALRAQAGKDACA